MTYKTVFRTLSALAIIFALAAGPAAAFSLPPGDYSGSAIVRTSLFEPNPAGGDDPYRVPGAIGGDIDAGFEDRAVFKIDAQQFGTLINDSHGVPVVDPDGGPAPGGEVLRGLFYDFNVSQVLVNNVPGVLPIGSPLAANTTYRIMYEAGDRYTTTGGVSGTWEDTHVPLGDTAADSVADAGGIIAWYAADPTTDSADLDLPPTDWIEGQQAGGGGATPDGAMTATDTFPTFTVGDPWLVTALMPLPDVKLQALNAPTGTVSVLSVTTDNSGAVENSIATAFGNIIGGTSLSNTQWGTNVFGPGLDIRYEFKPNFVGVSGWQSGGVDPISYSVLPEPATISLMGLGIASLAGAHLKRRRKT